MEEKVKGKNEEGRNGVKEKGKRGKGKGGMGKEEGGKCSNISLCVYYFACRTSRALPCFRHSLMKSHK
jgi:hypothetical protein